MTHALAPSTGFREVICELAAFALDIVGFQFNLPNLTYTVPTLTRRKYQVTVS